MNAYSANPRVVRLLTAALATACIIGFIAIVIAADRGTLPSWVHQLYDWPGGDKVGHIVLLAMVTFAVALMLRGRRVRLGRRHVPLAAVLVAVGITLEELSQAWFPGRTFSLVDLVCSYLGIMLGSRAASARRGRFGAAAE